VLGELGLIALENGRPQEAAHRFEQSVMDRAYFDALANRFRSPHLWAHADGAWRLQRVNWLSLNGRTPPRDVFR